MSGRVAGMGYDIHRSQQSFTSPMGYFMNMMP
jgi:hypothetical protein